MSGIELGHPKFHWFPTKIQNSSMIMSSMFLQGSRIQDTHNVYYYDAPLTFKESTTSVVIT